MNHELYWTLLKHFNIKQEFDIESFMNYQKFMFRPLWFNNYSSRKLTHTLRTFGFESKLDSGIGIFDSHLQTSNDEDWKWYKRWTHIRSGKQLCQTIQFTCISSIQLQYKMKVKKNNKLRSCKQEHSSFMANFWSELLFCFINSFICSSMFLIHYR